MRRIIMVCLLLLIATTAYAESDADKAVVAKKEVSGSKEDKSAKSPEGEVHQLDVVEVEEEKNEAGKTSIGGQTLQSLPSRSNSITEALKGMSQIQFSSEELSSHRAGEIRPPRISISGGKPYENNFMIDGMTITNTLDPSGFSDKYTPENLAVGGGDQTIFYNTKLIDNITVYTSNVPAKFGGFVGGVVDSGLRDPSTDKWHFSVEGRHNRNEWVNLRDVNEQSKSESSQPEFRIYNLSAVAEGPINEKISLLFAYTRDQSDIPLLFESKDETVREKRDQHRINENFFAKLLLEPTNDLTFRLDATYAPYKEERWHGTYEDSEWGVYNDAYRFGIQAQYNSDVGMFTGKAAYMLHGYSAESESNHRYYNTNTKEAYGGLGDTTRENKDFDLTLEYDSKRLTAGSVEWSISTGLNYHNTITDAWNEEAALDTDVVSRSGKRTVISLKYDEIKQNDSLNTFGYYAQADLQWKRLTVTPGFRVDYDDFAENVDVAPRLKAEYDTFGDGTMRLVAGANRYYSSSLRGYAFDRFRPYNRIMSIDTNNDGVFERVFRTRNIDRSYNAKDLKTPHSDELTAGLLGSVYGFNYSLEFVKRRNENQVMSMSEDGENFWLTNGGESEYTGLTFQVSRAVNLYTYGNHIFSLGATKSRTTTFSGGYDSDSYKKDENGYKYDCKNVYFEGEYKDRSDLPADNFNAPLILTFSWQGSFLEDRLRFNTVTRWRDSSMRIMQDKRLKSDTPYGTTSLRNDKKSEKWIGPDGKFHEAFKEGIVSAGFVTDLGLEVDVLKEELVTLTMMLDVNNIFDDTAGVGIKRKDNTIGGTSRGRSFYAGIRCEF